MKLVTLNSVCLQRPTSELEEAVTERLPLHDRLRAAQLDLARCAATLGWMAENPEIDIADRAIAISRRVRAIRVYVEIELRERKVLGSPEVNLRSPHVEQVVNLLLDTFSQVAEEVTETDAANEMIALLGTRIEGWQDLGG